uniref:Uncharacterized protein n=1 Tax=Arundo donax TaxID=35708 RepID=A0A0A9BW48_ARUDO
MDKALLSSSLLPSLLGTVAGTVVAGARLLSLRVLHRSHRGTACTLRASLHGLESVEGSTPRWSAPRRCSKRLRTPW